MEIQLSFKELGDQLDFIVEQLAGVPGIQRIDLSPPLPPAPDSKGMEAVSGFIVKLVPDAIEAVLDAVAKATKRITPIATEVTVSTGPETNTLTAKFDPRYVTSDEISKMSAKLVRTLQTPRSTVAGR
jgi:hypothetical protein